MLLHKNGSFNVFLLHGLPEASKLEARVFNSVSNNRPSVPVCRTQSWTRGQ